MSTLIANEGKTLSFTDSGQDAAYLQNPNSPSGLYSTLIKLSLLLGLLFMGSMLYANGPCNADQYIFAKSDDTDLVPCGPSANTTSSFPIDDQGPHDEGASGIVAMDLDCMANLGDESADGPDVHWVTFVINLGGSFEWQTVPGADKFTYSLYYSATPYTGTFGSGTEVDSYCSDLQFVKCGDQFTGWDLISTPDPAKQWRFFLAYYLNSTDKDEKGDGVVKIRKSCGLACEGMEPTVSIDDVCTLSGSVTLTATGVSGGGGETYSYIWSEKTAGVLVGETGSSLSLPSGSVPLAGTYTVVVTGSNGCPGFDSAIVSTTGCCNAEAGDIAITFGGPLSTLCRGAEDLDLVQFSAENHLDDVTTGYSYALFLVDMDGNIIDSPAPVGSDGGAAFTFSTLPNGMYTVYGLSFLDDQPGYTTAEAYVNSVTNISEIIGDDSDDSSGGTGPFGTLCLDLVSGGAGNKVTIVGGDCGNLPGPPEPADFKSSSNQ